MSESAVRADLAPDDATRVAQNLARAITLHQQGQVQRAQVLYQRVLTAQPANFQALHLLGVIALHAGDAAHAADLIERAVAIEPDQAQAQASLGHALMALKRFPEALRSYEQALHLQPQFPEVLYNRGNILLELKRADEALESYDQALRIRPDHLPSLSNHGNALLALGRFEEALQDYERVLQLAPTSVIALSNRGNVLLKLRRPRQALESYERALRLDPRSTAALYNSGNALMELKLYEQALGSYSRALRVKADFPEALYGQGNALQMLRRYEEARDTYARVVALDPSHEYARGYLLLCRLLCCDWREHAELAEAIIEAVMAQQRSAMPFALLPVTDSAAAQLQCARTFIADRFPATSTPLWNGEIYKHDRIRVAYVSADFREHALSYLIAGLLETHDRQRFEIIAVSLRADDRSNSGRRVRAACDRHVEASDMPDADIAGLLRSMEVDIAVDLTGLTDGLRTGVFARRPAPVQVNYLGFPATMGAPYIDYLIADDFVVPQRSRQHYAEQVVYLPDTFQANDSRRAISPRTLTRMDCGLPQSGVVLCSFNNPHKLNPTCFDIWMRLLSAVPASALWLVDGGPVMEKNLRRKAAAHGVKPERLIFAPMLDYPQHLARLSVADLFLDSLPFNAGATASDALWAGVPVLTCSGEAFAARMAGSLLRAIGLPELIAADIAEYEARALELMREPDKLAALRAKLALHRITAPLFDTERFCKHIESAYVTMWERTQRGEPPAAFAVPRTEATSPGCPTRADRVT